MSQNEQVEYQDPILTPGNLRKIVQNLPSKAKDLHSEYEYDCDSDTFENEINEFFKYTEVTVQLQEYRKLYERHYGPNKTINSEDMISLLDQLDLLDQESRLKASKILVHIALGNFTTNKNESRQERVEKLVCCNNMLIECGAFAIIYQKLQKSLDSSIESDLYLTILYVLLESQRFQYPSKTSNKLKLDMFTLKPNPTEFLFLCVAKLREKLNSSFPVKKIILLLWKSLLFISGGLDHIKKTKQKSKESLGLSDNKSLSKSTPQDLYFFQNEVMNRYPTYIPHKFPFDIASPLTLQASTTLAQAMGYTNATNQIELLYQTLFPPKSSSSSSSSNSVFQLMSNNNKKSNLYLYSSHAFPTLVLPLNHDGLSVPESIKEAGHVFVSNMHTSLSNYQIIQERSKGIQRWKWIQQDKKGLKEKEEEKEGDDLLEQIYANVIPEFQNVIIVLLKLLLAAVTTSNGAQEEARDNLREDITLSYLEDMDAVRNREVYSKAISGILLLLLKWIKSSHVLKFEYISQLLVDSGCLLLILKIIGLQEITDLVKAQTDIPYYNFLDYNINRDIDSIEPQSTTNTNRRNMFWAINYLRVLQMLTKHKIHRTMLLAQYKSSALLKRMLKISHPVLELYTLKLLKSQVPYLGRKWRSQNMRIVSAIYLNCHTVLKDDWISKTNFDNDLEEGKMQEHNLRILTYTYNGERYLPSLLPVHDELQTSLGPGFNGFQRYEMDRTDQDDMEELDQEFQKNYKTWLDSETFYQTDDDDEVDTEQMNTTAPDTPYPQDTQKITGISFDELTKEINKLYIEQLNEQFKPIKKYELKNSDQQKVVVVDEDELIYNLIHVQDATVQKWQENQQSSAKQVDPRYQYFLFDDDMINSDEM